MSLRGEARRAAWLACVLALAASAWAQDGAEADGPPSMAFTPAELREGVPGTEIPVGAPCEAPGAEVRIEGVGRAVYDRIDVDSAAGRGRLWGGVCIEVSGQDVVLRVAEVRLEEMNSEAPVLFAEAVVLDVSGWRLRVARLEGPVHALEAREVALYAPGMAGAAAEIRMAGNEATLTRVALATGEYLLQAREATLAGETLTLRDARGTSCTCDVPRYHLEGRTARVQIGGGAAVIDEPMLEVLGVRVSLGPRLTLGEEGPELELPYTVGRRGELGTVLVAQPPPYRGVRVEMGGSLSSEPRFLTTLRASAGGTRISLDADARGLWLQGRAHQPVGGGAWVAALSDTRLRGDEPRLRAGMEAGLDRRTRLGPEEAFNVGLQLELRGGAEIAAEPDTGAAAPRFPFRAEARLGAPLAGGLSASLRVTAAATAYPGATPGGRASLALAPGLRLEGPLGPLDGRLALGAHRRLVTGGGPFAFDRVSARSRVWAEGRLSHGGVRADARVAWRLAPEAPGAEDLRGSLRAELPLGGDWTVRPSLRAELAGLAGGPGGEDWLEGGVSATGPILGEASEVGLHVRTGVEGWTLRQVRARVATGMEVQLEGGSIRLEPSLEVDVAPLVRGSGGVEVRSHGLRTVLRDCCGGLVLGYETEDGETSFEVGVRLPPLRLDEPPQPSLPSIPPLPSLERPDD